MGEGCWPTESNEEEKMMVGTFLKGHFLNLHSECFCPNYITLLPKTSLLIFKGASVYRTAEIISSLTHDFAFRKRDAKYNLK